MERGVGANGRWEPRTRDKYGELVSGYIERAVDPSLSPLGDVKLSALTVDRIARWSQANQPALAASTASAALGVVQQICRYGERQGWIDHNPVSRLEQHERPTGRSRPAAVLDDADFVRLLEHAHTMRRLFEFMAYTGLRVGEAVGLTSDARICLHGLRHRYASLLLAAGIDVVYVAGQLGHSNPRITLTTYAHHFAAADHARAARLAIDTHHHAQTMETVVVTHDSI